ncbi:MAG: hypothetical protein WKG01_36740 [Kofleriaceae bacterium]
MIPHTPLDVSRLSAAAQRALGPGPGRTMAARGMLPLPPADQICVLYQLAIEGDPLIAQSARLTASGLPEKLVAGTLSDPTTDPRVLDYFGQLAIDKPAVFDTIVLNPATADPTIATLAAKAGAREIDLIAQNEQRLLRHPEIITAMYMNRRARMSTIDRVVELAVRNHVRVPGLAAWDEVARALTGNTTGNRPASPDADAVFAQAVEMLTGDDSVLTVGDADQVIPDEEHVAPPPTGPEKDVQINKLSIPQKIRMATLGNAFARGILVRDPIRMVAVAAIKSPGVTEIEAARYAGNPGLAEDVIRYIATRREWTKLYGIKFSLCKNPKAPVAETTRMLPFLRAKDLATLSKSRGIPSALAAQARKLMLQRRGT